jgi:N-acetylglucosaminyl-diphospho-decaprenol L-rhamnosyltransferase
MPVVLFSYSGTLGGAERVLLDFALALPGERWLACPEGQLSTVARDAGLRVRELRSRPVQLRSSPRTGVRAAGHLAAHAAETRAVVRDLEADLVIACGMRSGLALLAPPRISVPVIFMHNDMLPGPRVGAAVRRAAAAADLVIVPSHAVAQELAVTPAPRVVAPGVDIDGFSDVPAPADDPEVLVLGALVAWKQPDFALEVAALARRRVPELRLRFVGAPLADDGLLARLRARAGQPDLEGAVEFAGSVADPRPELAHSRCLLHCARREPFGLALVEAMAAARPVIAPDCAGPAEIVDGRCGVLYPPGDVSACAQALVRVLGDPDAARAMGEAGRARARERFDRRRTCRELAAAAAGLRRQASSPEASGPEAGAGRLALLTVTHNSASDLETLLSSVARHLPGARVVVVDCASTDDTVAVAGRFAGTEVVALSENVGFGRACNRGLEELDEPVTALVNPDVELLDTSLLALATEAACGEGPPRLLAPLVLSPDGTRQDTVHPAPGSPADLLGSILPLRLVPGAASWRARAPRPVGWAVACALVARTETLRELGPFDDRIFLYGEDLELGLRAAAAGVGTWFDPRARVLHRRAHATSAAFGGEPFALLARARRDVLARRYGRGRVMLDDLAQAVTFATRIAAKRLLGRSTLRERRQFEALRRARR